MTRLPAVSQGGRQDGVTLVEIVVALTVTALALALATGGLRLLGASGERGAAVVARHDAISRSIDVLRRDIERLERVVWKRGELAQFAFHGDSARLTFVAIEPGFPSEPGPYFIAYAIQPTPGGATLTRERAPFNASAVDILRLPTQDSVALIEGAHRLRFLYLDRKGGRDRWLTQWPDLMRLPALIALEMAGLDGTTLPPIVFRPRIEAELACVGDGTSLCTLGSNGVLAPVPAGQGSGK